MKGIEKMEIFFKGKLVESQTVSDMAKIDVNHL